MRVGVITDGNGIKFRPDSLYILSLVIILVYKYGDSFRGLKLPDNAFKHVKEILGSIPILGTMENKPRIKFKNFWIWFKDQVKRKRFFYNFFITRNAWGAFSINSHINQHTGQPKVMYNTVKSAQKSADAMTKKTGKHFSFYKCLFCDGYHVGKNRDNK